MTINVNDALANDMLTQIKAHVEAGAGAGKLRLYDGAKPAGPSTAVTTQVLLAEFTLADPAFATPAARSMTLDADPDIEVVGLADGDPTWGRVLDSDNTAVYDGTAGTNVSDDFTLDAASITTDQGVKLVSGTLSVPV